MGNSLLRCQELVLGLGAPLAHASLHPIDSAAGCGSMRIHLACGSTPSASP